MCFSKMYELVGINCMILANFPHFPNDINREFEIQNQPFPAPMRIAEIPSSPHTQTQTQTQTHLLSQISSSITLLESTPPQTPNPTPLRLLLSQLSQLAPFPNSLKLDIWKLTYLLWNALVDLSNTNSSSKHDQNHSELRHFAADLLLLAEDVDGISSPKLKIASFFYKCGTIWHEKRNYETANRCFEKATDLVAKVEVNLVTDFDEQRLLLDINIARSRTCWDSSDRNLSIVLLNRAKSLLFGSGERCRVLANQYLTYGKELLSSNEVSGVNEAQKLLNEALELCEKGLRIVKRTEETLGLKELRSKVLRFIGALHLQRDEFDSVLKCVKVLRESGGDKHPSLSVLSMKAWLGLGKYVEAEKELRGMVPDKGIPEGVCVAAVESYFQSAGAAGAETAKEVFLGLLGRCHVSARATIRVVNRVIGEGGGGEGMKVRAKVVAELVSDDRVVELFAGEGPAKERSGMHALLWTW